MQFSKNFISLITLGATISFIDGCKTTTKTSAQHVKKNSADGNSPVGEVNSISKIGEKSEWETPYNLVDINQPVQEATKVILTGDIERISVDNPEDVFSSGLIEMSGMRVVIPANLLIRLPNKFLTLQELFTKARPECIAKKQTGLALADTCFFETRGAIATIQANRTGTGVVIAGEVSIQKAAEFVTGVVTYIDYNEGYFRLNGDPKFPASKTTGVMVRLNDPTARHSIQNGSGCGTNGPNCTPDSRFSIEPDNYTATFITGYPLCIPSSKTGPNRGAGLTFNAGTAALTGSDAKCPFGNRPTDPSTTPVPDSRVFAPIKIGDSMNVTGNFEKVSGVMFLSANAIVVHAGLKTSPGKPDYLRFSETIWEVAGYPRGRARGAWLGFTTDPNSQIDLYRVAIDPADQNASTREHEIPLGSTVNNPGTFNIGVTPTINHIFRVRFKDNFVIGASGRLSPCVHIANAGLDGGCASGATLNDGENFRVLAPVSREVLARTRNKSQNPTLASFDVSGNPAPNGVFQAPAEMDHPEFVEVNLNRIQTPFLFTGEPWNLDRRLGPGGCGGDHGSCAAGSTSLTPFPSDGGLDPRLQNLSGFNLLPSDTNRMIMSYPYSNTTDGPLLPWDTVDVNNSLTVGASNPVIFSQCVTTP